MVQPDSRTVSSKEVHMRDDMSSPEGINQTRRVEVELDASGPLLHWRAVLIGAGVACLALTVLAGAGLLLARWGVGADLVRSSGARAIALSVLMGLIGAIALGAWWGSRLSGPAGSIRLGPIVAGIVTIGVAAVAWPTIQGYADFRSVAIALGIVEAPDVGTRVSEALHRLVEAQRARVGPAEEDALDVAWSHFRATAWFLGAVLAALVAAGILGAALARRRAVSRAVRGGLAGALGAVAVGTAALTIALWPSLWAMTNAVVDFDQSAGPEIGVGLSEVARHPEVMWGKTVTVSARIDDRLSQHAILLGNDKPLVGDHVLVVGEPELQDLVLVAEAKHAELDAGDVVQVTGVVRPYDPAALTADAGIALDPNAVTGYGGSAVLVAEAIDVDVPIASVAGDKEFGSGSSGYDLGVTIDDILARPDEYVGLTVTVSDEVEEQLLTPHAFVLGDGALLCVSATPHPELFVEATAYVTGEVVRFDLGEIERRTGLDLDDGVFQGFEGRPVILVDSILLMT